MASAPWNDLLGFDAQLDETERQVRGQHPQLLWTSN